MTTASYPVHVFIVARFICLFCLFRHDLNEFISSFHPKKLLWSVFMNCNLHLVCHGSSFQLVPSDFHCFILSRAFWDTRLLQDTHLAALKVPLAAQRWDGVFYTSQYTYNPLSFPFPVVAKYLYFAVGITCSQSYNTVIDLVEFRWMRHNSTWPP